MYTLDLLQRALGYRITLKFYPEDRRPGDGKGPLGITTATVEGQTLEEGLSNASLTIQQHEERKR